ncbi:MAG TPA: histidine phosphatase family protein [Amycolatopsis sp.]|nr:histidine phosphatase family protein [Amycolatopsis sp.]
MTRTLIVLRHAKSAWPDDVPDFDRPLAGRGRRDAPAAGEWLAEHTGRIGLVLCSPAKRARQTWKRVSAELPREPRVRYEPRIYDADVPTLLDVVREVPRAVRTVVLVGHNPGLSLLVERLTGATADLRTSSIAVIEAETDWSGAKLRTVETPRG